MVWIHQNIKSILYKKFVFNLRVIYWDIVQIESKIFLLRRFKFVEFTDFNWLQLEYAVSRYDRISMAENIMVTNGYNNQTLTKVMHQWLIMYQ